MCSIWRLCSNTAAATLKLIYFAIVLYFFREAQVFPSFMAGFVSMFGLLVFGTCLLLPPMRWVLRTFFLPAPGEGPSEAAMDEGFLKVIWGNGIYIYSYLIQ